MGFRMFYVSPGRLRQRFVSFCELAQANLGAFSKEEYILKILTVLW